MAASGWLAAVVLANQKSGWLGFGFLADAPLGLEPKAATYCLSCLRSAFVGVALLDRSCIGPLLFHCLDSTTTLLSPLRSYFSLLLPVLTLM